MGVDPRSRGFSFGSKTENKSKEIKRQSSLEGTVDHHKVNGLNSEGKQHARDILSHKLEEAVEIEKRHSNGILMSPVSTKGEVTMTQSTKSSPSSTHTTSPLVQKKQFPPIKTPSPVSIASDPSKETTEPASSTKKKHTESVKEPSPILQHKNTEAKQLRQTRSSSSDDTVPLLRLGSSSSSGTFSPTDEFRFVPQTNSGSWEDRERDRRDSSTASDEVYDKLETLTSPRPDSVGPFSGSSTPSSRSTPGLTDHQFRPESVEFSRCSTSPESGGSGVYDHLPALDEPETQHEYTPTKIKDFTKLSLLSTPLNFAAQRNISQPALSTPSSARGSPIDHIRETPIREESSDEAGTPTNR